MRGVIFSEDLPPIAWSDVSAYEFEYGVKCSTTLAIPRAWTPEFVILSTGISQEIAAKKQITSTLDRSTLNRIQRLAAPLNQIFIRSSVVGESIWDRGKYCSVPVDCGSTNFAEDFCAAASEVIEDAPDGKTGLLIQRYIAPVRQGEFGNLLRISRTRDHWEISTVDRNELKTVQRLNCQRDSAANALAPLLLSSGLSRQRLFGSIAAWLNNDLLLGERTRLNCEWISDHDTLFVVQIDEEDEDLRGFNPFQFRVSPSRQPASSSGTYLKIADDNDAMAAWDKVGVLKQLWEPGASHKPTLFVIRLEDLPEPDNAVGHATLEEDFRKLIGSDGIVVRTSVAAEDTKEDITVNLPRTECLTPARAVKWCINTARELGGRPDFDLSSLAFVAHRFVAARASAWVRADPKSPTVEINALWGLPDALQVCPYDIWEVHVPTQNATAYPNYKSDMLAHKPDGHWEYRRIKNELARHNCIKSSDAKELAVRSHAIANRLGSDCHIMWFVGCIEADGQSFNMPWYWTKAHVTSKHNDDRDAYHTIEVSDRNTLLEFKNRRGLRLRQALALKPVTQQLMRDNDFMADVGIAAKEANVPVILFGSTLAHAYYTLRSAGCTVVTPSEKQHSKVRSKARFGKIVRDNIPTKIDKRQELSFSEQTFGVEKKGYLIGKLVEEAMEVRAARDKRQKVEEFADLFEVLRSLAGIEGILTKSIESTARLKRKKAGGFDKGIVLHSTGIPTKGGEGRIDAETGTQEVFMEQISADTVEVPFRSSDSWKWTLRGQSHWKTLGCTCSSHFVMTVSRLS